MSEGHTHDQRRDCPDESIQASETGHVQSTKLSVKVDANALSIIALMLSVAAIVIVIAQAVMQPQVIDAKIEAGAAKAEATAHSAETHARVALDKVEDFRAKLAEKGIKINTDGH